MGKRCILLKQRVWLQVGSGLSVNNAEVMSQDYLSAFKLYKYLEFKDQTKNALQKMSRKIYYEHNLLARCNGPRLWSFLILLHELASVSKQ